MTAIEMLKQDHRAVQRLFHRFAKAGDRAFQQKRRIAEKTFKALDLHTKLEEEIFYPAVRIADPSRNDMVNEATEEHHVAKSLIRELQMMAPNAENYDATFEVLAEKVRQHIRAEETDMLPHAAAQLDNAELDQLRDGMAVRKRELVSAQQSLIAGTLQQAKRLVAKAFDALTTSSAPETHSLQDTKSKRSSRRMAPRRKAAQSAPRSPRAKKSAGTRTVQRAAAKTTGVKGTRRTVSSRKTIGRARAAKEQVRQVSRS